MESFAVLCKGKSLERLPNIEQQFDCCYIVNYWEKELLTFENILKKKMMVQFVNRRETIRMKEETYHKFRIRSVQFTMPEFINKWWAKKQISRCRTIDVDEKTWWRYFKYTNFGLNFLWLPEDVLFWQKDFEKIEKYPGEYMWKHPNTGVQACIVAAQSIKPKNLYIIGLDFYQDDYLYRQSKEEHMDLQPLDKQQEKMERCRIIEHFEKVLDYYTDINWHVVTNYKKLKHGDHVELI